MLPSKGFSPHVSSQCAREKFRNRLRRISMRIQGCRFVPEKHFGKQSRHKWCFKPDLNYWCFTRGPGGLMKRAKSTTLGLIFKHHLENKLLLISINFTPKTSHRCLKKWYDFLGFPGTFFQNWPHFFLDHWLDGLAGRQNFQIAWAFARFRSQGPKAFRGRPILEDPWEWYIFTYHEYLPSSKLT